MTNAENASATQKTSIRATSTRFVKNETGERALTAYSECIETIHYGWAVVFDSAHGLLHCTPGASEVSTFFRSAAKPFQAWPLVQWGLDAELTAEELALCCASHTGSARHVQLALDILKKAGLTEDALQCGAQPPADPAERERLRVNGERGGKRHNNCSGKHAGMLLACQRMGFSLNDYLEPAHPLQRAITAGLARTAETAREQIAVDGCGAPVHALPLHKMAELYTQLGSGLLMAPIRNAMLAHPEIVGGEGRVDTVVMQASGGEVLAKVGADGVLCAANVGTGQGMALKIGDGNTDARNTAFVHLLREIGWLSNAALQSEAIQTYARGERRNTQGLLIGRIHSEQWNTEEE